MKTAIIFNGALAPYRTDFFNSLNAIFKAHFYFLNKNVLSQKFDQNTLQERCQFKPNFLAGGFNIGKRSLRIDVISKLYKHNPDIVFCYEYNFTTIMILLYKWVFFSKYKIVTLCDDSLDIAKKCSGLRSIGRKLCLRYLDGIILINQDLVTWYRDNLNPRAKLMEFPIITSETSFRERFIFTEQQVENLKKQHNICDKTIILFVGRLVALKNIPTLLKAFATALKERDNLHLVIIGEGEELQNLNKIINKYNITNKVIFLGRKEDSDLYIWFQASKIFVLPSFYERFGAVVNEALLNGCYTICSNLAGAASLITSQNGALFNPYSPEELSESIIHFSTFPDKSGDLNLMPFKYSDKFRELEKDINLILSL